jgi:hypothetical protein
MALAALVPQSVGILATKVYPTASNIALATPLPAVTIADPSFSSVSLLLHMDGSNASTTFTDSSSAARSVTANGNAQISTAQSKYGGSSLYVDGVGDSASCTGVSFGTGDFTVEGFVRVTTPSSALPLIDTRPGDLATTGFIFYVRSTQKLAFGTGSPFVATEGTTTVSANTWHHIALTRSGTTVRLFLNGTLEASVTNSATLSNTSWQIGHQHNRSGTFSAAYIDDLRVTAGVARYTAAFTAPSVPFPNA